MSQQRDRELERLRAMTPAEKLRVADRYGEPRFTRDIDLVLAVRPPDEFYAPPHEVFETESARSEHGHFNEVWVRTLGLEAAWASALALDDPGW